MRLSERVRGIGTESAFEAASRARALEAQGRDVIHLEIGEPDFETPPNAFPSVSGTGLDGPALAERLLVEAGVSVLAGTAFGREGRAHLRVSYANPRANIARALDRMGQLLVAVSAG